MTKVRTEAMRRRKPDIRQSSKKNLWAEWALGSVLEDELFQQGLKRMCWRGWRSWQWGLDAAWVHLSSQLWEVETGSEELADLAV